MSQEPKFVAPWDARLALGGLLYLRPPYTWARIVDRVRDVLIELAETKEKLDDALDKREEAYRGRFEK